MVTGSTAIIISRIINCVILVTSFKTRLCSFLNCENLVEFLTEVSATPNTSVAWRACHDYKNDNKSWGKGKRLRWGAHSWPIGEETAESVTHDHCNARPTVTFLTAQCHCPLTSTKLYCLMNTEQSQVCEQLAQGCYPTVHSQTTETSDLVSNSRTCYNHYNTKPHLITGSINILLRGGEEKLMVSSSLSSLTVAEHSSSVSVRSIISIRRLDFTGESMPKHHRCCNNTTPHTKISNNPCFKHIIQFVVHGFQRNILVLSTTTPATMTAPYRVFPAKVITKSGTKCKTILCEKPPSTAGGLATSLSALMPHVCYMSCADRIHRLPKLGLECEMACGGEGIPIILPICHKCQLFYKCTSASPAPSHSSRYRCLLANRDNYHSIVVTARRQLLFDRGLDSSWRRAVTIYTEWADIGIGFHSQKILPNTQSTPIPSIGQYPVPQY